MTCTYTLKGHLALRAQIVTLPGQVSDLLWM